MSLIYAILLGLVQGLTEFLPVSSSGHLVVLNMFFGQGDNFLLVSILLHVATLLAVLIVFWKQVKEIIIHPLSAYSKNIYISFIPTVLIVLLTRKMIEGSFSGGYVSICFLITALLLMVCDFFAKEKHRHCDFEQGISKRNAFLMGVAQGVAVVPGISRSGATICTGLMLGENRDQTAKFSFLMSVPVILASLFYEVIFAESTASLAVAVFPTIVAFLVAFLTGIFAIKIMLKVVKKARYIWFSVYLIVIGLVTLFIL